MSSKAGSNPFQLTRGDYFGECALTEHPSPASYAAAGHVLLICMPAKTFEFVLSTTDEGDFSSYQEGGEGSNEETTLSTHIDQFLEILALFQSSAERDKLGGVRKKATVEDPGDDGASILGQEPVRSKKKRRSILQYSIETEENNSQAGGSDAAANPVVSDTIPAVSDSIGNDTESGSEPGDQSGPKFAAPNTNTTGATVTITATSLAAASARREREALMLELLTSLSPELGFDDITERICRLTKEFFAVDRVGFFLVDKENEKMILKVSQEGAGFSVPLKGIAGHIAKTAEIVNLPDCYEDHRFDPAMDMRTGYRTKQMLCVPVMDVPGEFSIWKDVLFIV